MFGTRADFFPLVGITAQLDEGDGRILLGDNTEVGRRLTAADQVPVCGCLDFNWTHLYVHK